MRKGEKKRGKERKREEKRDKREKSREKERRREKRREKDVQGQLLSAFNSQKEKTMYIGRNTRNLRTRSLRT